MVARACQATYIFGVLPFRKMNGLGNDFVVLDARREAIDLIAAQAVAIADRRRGVGCDQILIMKPSAGADCFMEIINPDGTFSSACGNGTRCVARLLINETGAKVVRIKTDAGVLVCEDVDDGRSVRVNMGAPKFDWREIPMAESGDTLNIPFPNLPDACAVNMGNPHVVFFVENVEKVDLARTGPTIENHPLFPERTNTEFCQVLGEHKIRMRVWERSAGITQACGSGACAVLVAAVRRGLVKDYAEIILDGGVLHIEWRTSDSCVYMTGPTQHSFSGILEPGLLQP